MTFAGFSYRKKDLNYKNLNYQENIQDFGQALNHDCESFAHAAFGEEKANQYIVLPTDKSNHSDILWAEFTLSVDKKKKTIDCYFKRK